MFDEIITLANERVVTGDDFKPFIGDHNWLAFDRAEPLGEAVCGDDEPWVQGAVYGFVILGVSPYDKVLISLDNVPGKDGVLWMDADELVIRMDAS